ncbi:MAG: hypothetical protein H8E20_13925 [Verrucomicrobia bacterium]|nr:hypothetical protein [Verrucomicrobiota bacterium]
MKTQTVLFTLVAALLVAGCGHHKHHRDQGGDRHDRGDESLAGKVIKYPFRMTGYALGAPFHPFKSTRKAFDATVDLPEKAVDSTAEALFGHDRSQHRDHDRGKDRKRNRNRDRGHEDDEDNDRKSRRERD